MRALQFFVVLMILLIATPGYAGVSDPNKILEESQVDSAYGSRSGTSSVAAPVTVTQKVTETVGNSVKAVKSWFNKSVQTLTGRAPKKAVAVTPQAQSPRQGAPKAKAAQAEAKRKELKALTDTFATPDLGQKARGEDLNEARRRLKNEGVAKISKPGRKSQKGLKMTKSGVPFMPMEVRKTVKLKGGKTKVVLSPLRDIPRLDIGEEPTLTKADYLGQSFEPKLVQVHDFKALPSPALLQAALKNIKGMVVMPVAPAKDLENATFGIDKIVTKEGIHKALPKIKTLAAIEEKPVTPMSPTQLKMLAALMLYNKGDRCNVLIGLFDDLSKTPKLKNEANFHLGQCAYRMKMTSLGFERLSTLITSEDRHFAGDAIGTLVKDMPMEYELTFSKLIRNLKNQKLIHKEDKNEVNYLTAKGAFKEGEYKAARAYAERVPESSSRYGNAQYLIGVSWFALGNATKGAGKLESLRHWMSEKKVNDKNLNSLTAINLARIKFTQGRFQEALPLYMAIDKDHPVWVQALIEQGWTQLAQDDFSGAIGNMYSLHSPYFRAVYKPESFVVRTIGYLNICQYGDAYRTLSWLEREYRPWTENVKQYSSKTKHASQYYDTVVRYLKGKSSQDIDGLPYQVIREMARQKEFLNAQTSLNAKVDEIGSYEGMDKVIVKEKNALKEREKKATTRFKDLKAKIAKAEKEKTEMAQIQEWRRQMKLERDLILGLRFQSEILETSRVAYVKLHPIVMNKIGKQITALREKAGRNLVETLARIKKEISTVLENNEFLRYEVYAGSGENIRYQVAGGKVAESNRIPASVKPEKMQNWDFDGEYWEDEIGSYRSSLRNNCPQVGKMSEFFKNKNESAAKGQAAIEKED